MEEDQAAAVDWSMLPLDIATLVLDILRSEASKPDTLQHTLRSKTDPRPSQSTPVQSLELMLAELTLPSPEELCAAPIACAAAVTAQQIYLGEAGYRRAACGAFRATCTRWQATHDMTCTTLRLKAGVWPLHGWGRFAEVTRVESMGIACHADHVERTFCHFWGHMDDMGCECIVDDSRAPRGVVWRAEHVAALRTLPSLHTLVLEAASDEALTEVGSLTTLTTIDLMRVQRSWPVCATLDTWAQLPRLSSLKLPQVPGRICRMQMLDGDRIEDVAVSLLELPMLEELELEIEGPTNDDLLSLVGIKALVTLWLETDDPYGRLAARCVVRKRGVL